MGDSRHVTLTFFFFFSFKYVLDGWTKNRQKMDKKMTCTGFQIFCRMSVAVMVESVVE